MNDTQLKAIPARPATGRVDEYGGLHVAASPGCKFCHGRGKFYDSVVLMPSDCESCVESAQRGLAPGAFERWNKETTFLYASGPVLPAYGLTQAELDCVRAAVLLDDEAFRQTSIDWVLVLNPATWDENRIAPARPFLAILAGRMATLLSTAAESMFQAPDGENPFNAIALTLTLLAERAAPLAALIDEEITLTQ